MKTPPVEFPITVFAKKAGVEFEIYAYRQLTDDEINREIARYIASDQPLLAKKNKIYTSIGKDDSPVT